MKIISISGLEGAGKDTAANFLIEHHGYKKISFSAALKDVVAAVFNWDREMLEGTTKEARESREQTDPWWSDQLGRDVSPRSMLMEIGTDVMRDHFEQNIWSLALHKRIVDSNPGAKLVSTDTRHFNEFALMQSMGATICGVHRKLPPWLEEFYVSVDTIMSHDGDLGLMESDLTKSYNMTPARNAAARFFLNNGLKVHQSQWEHLLWNQYDHVIDNTKTLDALRAKMEELA
jgi:hypothetical protein